jgi:ribonuclease D
MNGPWIWIDSPDKLRDARQKILQSRALCIDTEYDSFRYFRERLCLIQIRDGATTYLFDPLDSLDFSFLGDPFADPAVLKIFHAGDNDIRLLKRDYGFQFCRLFDTQRAASLLGSQHLALSTVIDAFLKIDLDKTKKMQRSRWDRRPLSDAQIRYAIRDTLFLFPLYETLSALLAERGLTEQAEAVFAGMAAVVWQEKIPHPHAHERIPGYEVLTDDERLRLRRLVEWRFAKAREVDRSAFMVLSDQELLRLSQSRTPTLAFFREEGLLSPGKIDRYGTEVLAVLMAAGTSPAG